MTDRDNIKLVALRKIMDNEHPCVCMLCWEDTKTPLVTLSECIILTAGYNPSNCKSHLRTTHTPEETPGLYSDCSTITNTNTIVTSKPAKPSQMNFFQYDSSVVATPQIALSHLYNFFNEANVAIAQANNKHLSNFINYLLDNSAQLRKKKQECLFSRHKYMTQRDERYVKFISSLKEIVTFSRNFYYSKFGKYEPFLCVSHDGWDSLDHDVLGVSLHFIVPVHWKVINLAVGLKRIRSKKSVETSNAILIILKRYVS